MRKLATLLVLALVVSLVAHSEEPGQKLTAAGWEGDWITTWNEMPPGFCVKFWREKSTQKLYGTRHRGGPNSTCSLLKGEELAGGRVFAGQEFVWNENAQGPVEGEVGQRRFHLILSEDGKVIHGHQTDKTYGGPTPWWGVRKNDCTTNESAWKNCKYPK